MPRISENTVFRGKKYPTNQGDKNNEVDCTPPNASAGDRAQGTSTHQQRKRVGEQL